MCKLVGCNAREIADCAESREKHVVRSDDGTRNSSCDEFCMELEAGVGGCNFPFSRMR
jgi:hypothetical protein